MNKIYEVYQSDGSEPVTLQQAKDFCRITTEDDDDLITDLITVARKKVERFTSISLVDKTVILTGELCEMFPLPYPNINDITTVKFWQGQNTDGTNDYETLEADEYYLIGYGVKHFKPQKKGVYEITYTTTANTDGALKLDLKRIVLWLYENRGDTQEEIPNELFSNCKHLRLLNWL